MEEYTRSPCSSRAARAAAALSLGLPAFRNYEQIVKAHQDNPHEGEDQVSDQVKFNVFQGIMDSLFQSFNASISVASFQELSACVFSWIEEHCKPQVWGSSAHGVWGLFPTASGKMTPAIICSERQSSSF